MNPKIEQIEAAEAAIAKFKVKENDLRREALADGIIDADEQADLDRLLAKIEQLTTAVRKSHKTLEENRRIWEAQQAAVTEWREQLTVMKEAGHAGLGKFEAADKAMTAAVADQRWADATKLANLSLSELAQVYAKFAAEVPEMAGGGTAPPPPIPTADPNQDQWNSAKAEYTDALAALERHAQAGHAVIAAEITTTKASAAAAETLANGGDFDGAAKAITPLITACAASEEKAHGLAHYTSILNHRLGLATTSPGSDKPGTAAIDDLADEMAKLLADAQIDATAGKYDAAVLKLDKIPLIFDRKRVITKRVVEYTPLVTNITQLAANIDAEPAPSKAPVQAQITKLKADFVAFQFAKTNDYQLSVAKLGELQGEYNALQTLVYGATDYTAVLTAFDAQMAILDPHAGRVAIEEFFQARKIDRNQAVADAAATKFATAQAILQSTPAASWTAQKAIADAYSTYITNRTAAQTAIDAVRALPNTTELIAQADALMVTAANQALVKNIAAAEQSVTEAKARADDAKAASEAQAALGALKDKGALDGAADDFPAALAVYTNMRANVQGKDTSGAFAAKLTEADVPVEAAKTEAAKATPDMGVVRAKLDGGIAILEALLPQVLAGGLYQTHLATAKTLIDTTLPPLNVDNCIKTALDACKVLLTEAEDLAKAPALDFAGAEAKLSAAMERGRKAQSDAALYTSIQADKTTTANAVTLITTATAGVQVLLAPRTTRLNGIVTAIETAVAAEDFTLAAAKGTEGVAVAVATAQDNGYCLDIDANYDNWITNMIGQIQGGEPSVAKALADTNKLLADYNTCLTQGTYFSAWRSLVEARWAIRGGIDNLALEGKYNTAQAKTRGQLDAVVAVRNAVVEIQLAGLETRYTAAVTMAAEPQYARAQGLMETIGDEAGALLPIAQSFGDYDKARTEADTKLVEAEGHAQISAIQTIVTRLRGKFVNAEGVANGGDAARAQTMMEEIKSGAEDAIGNADGSAVFEGIAGVIADSASDSWGPTFVHIAAARKAYDWQSKKDNAAVASKELADADAQLKIAEDSSASGPDQTKALEAAMALVTEAGQVISQHTLLIEALVMAKAKVSEHKGHAQGSYLTAQLSDVETRIAAVEAAATSLAALTGCSADLETIMDELVTMAPKLDARAEYVTLRATPEVEPRLAVLEAHAHSYAVQSNIEAMRRKLDEAARLSDSFDPIAAVAVLKEVKDIGLSSLVLAEMRDNKAPSKTDIEEILARPGGSAELDAMVDALEPDAQRKVLEVAFEARFGCNLQNFAGVDGNGNPNNPVTDLTKDGPNIKRFYEIMSDLPEGATLDNDSMRKFTEIESGQGSLYDGSTKDVVMREGDAALSSAYSFGAEDQVGQVDPGCEPADDEPVSFFSWNTLHEVGHAVDDQHGYMDKNQSSPDHGGWVVYGANVAPIATVLAAHFKYDKNYIQQAMSQRLAVAGPGGNAADLAPGLPPPAGGAMPEDWEGRRVAFITWLAQVREPRNPWSSNSVAQQIAIGGVVYQESYTTNWTSYKLAARSKGMTGYQFRAPGEWFSELYAAYHSGKIKDGHPAAGWLKKLDGPGA